MKKNITTLLLIILSSPAFAQQKDFEGIMFYKTDVRSKTELVSDRALKNMLAVGNDVIIKIKHGNYRQTTGKNDFYYISKDQTVYIKFNGIDTLYYMAYASDTPVVTKISKSDEKKMIAGLECKLITIQSGTTSRKYYYSPSLYMNPEYDRNNKIGGYDVFAKETSSLYLDFNEENPSYSLLQTCTRVENSSIDDSIFRLPDLPRKKFSYGDLIIAAEFTRSGGWAKYLQTNLDGQVAAKYLKIPKGEEKVSQQVFVRFLVNENGKVVSAEVLNKKEVHPKLAEEALRVVNASPLWKPATFCGEKVIFWMQNPITFEVTKQ
jgi:hypothetical protein